MRRLYRSRKEKVFAGICGGLGEYLVIDPVIIRVITIILTILTFLPLLVYIIAIFIIPLKPLNEVEDSSTSSNQTNAAGNSIKNHAMSPEQKKAEKIRMGEHIRTLGILYIALNALGIIAAAIVFIIFFSIGAIAHDGDAIIASRILGIAISASLLIFSLPGVFAGFGLIKKESWARILALVLGFINLINIPFGTMLGIYTIWVLTKPETLEHFNLQSG